ncbi:nucleotidyl transferase AbiEii/AbiGii toxin family protein [Lacrimispora amygdalina]|jgi:predicted nucleotidyltransferase component of viral defense system|uniref:Nucleotidyl transferase AbiEii/AbiGii toxin family protein n=1 Tax=Lacrimispora amygdalina TaxID=253257 RepID=A0A3E2NGP4_9FIRM|nr:nucleotidyl transferase AbiEii/AbiGii toxin family protein [Clostridium indicum]RFZ80167.1 nucleotidyl transferase AbiEii/AbiGii toxin family protein [Clostridium indicum]
MNLHQDKDAFEALLSDVSRRTGIRSDIVEKDYYLTLLLWELSKKQNFLPAYFKGGTALYKSIGRMKRFSEDIDLTVAVQDCSKSQGKKRLETSANGYHTLSRTTDKARESNQRGSITSVYEYVPVTAVDSADSLQRFGYVKVEATSFTISEPVEALEVSPLLYSEATGEQRQILESAYGVKPFSVQTIKLERIFADKILAAEFYYQRRMLFDTAKHLYDLAIMMEQERIRTLLSAPEELTAMLAYKRKEERERIGSDLSEKPFSEFTLFDAVGTDDELAAAFSKMQKIYVFSQRDILSPVRLSESMAALNQTLLQLDEGLERTQAPGGQTQQKML